MAQHVVGRVAVATAVILLAGGAIAQAVSKPVTVKAGNYKGTNSEQGTVTLTIVGSKVSNRKIQHLRTEIHYNGKCGGGGGAGYLIDASGIKIKPNGTFSAQIKLAGQTPGVPAVKGSLTGSASGSHIHGKIVDLKLAHQKCNGYIETFSASHT